MSSPCLESFFNKLSIVTQLLAWAHELLHKHVPCHVGAFQDKGRARGSSRGRAWVLVLFSFCFKLIHKHSNQLKTSDFSRNLWEPGRLLRLPASPFRRKRSQFRLVWLRRNPQKCVHERWRVSAVCTQVVRCHVKLHGWSRCLSAALWRAPRVGGGLIDG